MLLICNNWTLSHIINDGYYLNITVEACRFHVMLKYLSFLMIRVLITFCTVNTLQICWFIREFEHLKVSFVCGYSCFGCLNGVHIPHQQYFTTPSLRATFPPSGNLLYFCLPLHFTLFYLFIFLSLLFLLRSAGTVWALLGTRRWSHPINNAECFYGNCLATVARCNCLQCGRGERHQDDTETGSGIKTQNWTHLVI